MADDNKLVAEPRDKFGKGAARKIRAAGKIPAVIYGHGTEPQHVTLPGARGRPDPAQGERGARPRHLGQEPARARQGRAEGPGAPDHRAHRPRSSSARARRSPSTCPVHVEGESFPGTLVALDANTLSVEAEATHIPERLTVDVEGLEEGQHIYAKDVDAARGHRPCSPTPTRSWSTSRCPPRSTWARPRRPKAEAAEGEEGAEGEEAAEGAEAASEEAAE